MNVILLTLFLLTVFFIIQKNSKFQGNNYPLKGGSNGGGVLKNIKNTLNLKTTKEKRVELITSLKNISTSDKVTISNVEDKWSLNKTTIDHETKKKAVNIVKDVMENIGWFSDNKFFVRDIENIYVMKDKNENFRSIISCFIHDIKNFHTIKLIIDVVYFDNIIYINHIDIDESGIKNVLQHYDIKYKSSGILSNYNNFDHNVEVMIDNFYKEKYKLIPLEDSRDLDLSGTFSFTELKAHFKQKEAINKSSPYICNKEKTTWNTKGVNFAGDESCTFNNSSIKDYPYLPRDIPGGIVNNVDINTYKWLNDPIRGHTVSSLS